MLNIFQNRQQNEIELRSFLILEHCLVTVSGCVKRHHTASAATLYRSLVHVEVSLLCRFCLYLHHQICRHSINVNVNMRFTKLVCDQLTK